MTQNQLERRRRWIEQIEEQIEYVDECAPEFQSAMDIEIEYRKRLLSLLRRVRRCPECRGRGTVAGQEWTGRPWMEYQVLVQEDCPTCGGTGRL